MKRADYRRQEHNRKKQERAQREKEEKKQEEKALFRKSLREDWKMYLGFTLLFIFVIWFIVFFTIKTGNPLLLMVVWWKVYRSLCFKCKRYKPKIFRWLPVIPILEFILFVALTIYTIVTDKWAIGRIDLGLISLCAFFNSIINTVWYLGAKFENYRYKK